MDEYIVWGTMDEDNGWGWGEWLRMRTMDEDEDNGWEWGKLLRRDNGWEWG